MTNNNTPNTSSIVSKVWAFCQTLRDVGVGGNFLKQDFRMKRLTGFAFNKLLLHQLSWQEAFYKNDLICMNEYRKGKAFIKRK